MYVEYLGQSSIVFLHDTYIKQFLKYLVVLNVIINQY